MKKRTKNLILSRESAHRLDAARGGDVEPDPPSVRSACGETTSAYATCDSFCNCWSAIFSCKTCPP